MYRTILKEKQQLFAPIPGFAGGNPVACFGLSYYNPPTVAILE